MIERDNVELHDCTIMGDSTVKNRPRNDRVGYLAINSASSLFLLPLKRPKMAYKRFYPMMAIFYLVNNLKRVERNYGRIKGVLV